MNNLYQAILFDHYKNPRNCKKLQNADFTSGSYNPSCGDSISIQGCVKNNKITNSAFTGSGCVISQATASILIEFIHNKLLTEIQALDKNAVLTMIGMQLGPMRLKCALLPLQALQEGIASYCQEKNSA